MNQSGFVHPSSFILHPSSFILFCAAYALTRSEQMTLMQAVLQFWDAAKGSAAILAALALFLITLETRLKRHRALRAVHELRAMAHLIDMYQLTKTPDRCSHQSQPVEGLRKTDRCQGYWPLLALLH